MGGLNPAGEKALLRAWLLRERAAVPEKAERSARIFRLVTGLPAYQSAGRIFAYVSLPDEVETRAVISHALSQGKEVFAPHCPRGGGEMAFYRVASLEELRPGNFGVWEPEPRPDRKAVPHAGDFCLVPGLAFDWRGNRLGYGKGCYDRFLAGYPVETAGLCWHALYRESLPTDGYDRPVRLVITEQDVFPARAGRVSEA